MRGDRASGLVMCQRGGNKHLLFQRRNLPFAGADLRDDPGFQLRAIDTLLNFIDHLLRQFLHAAGRHMFREKRVLVITGTGHHVDPGFAHYIEHKLRIAPHVTVGHLNHITHAPGHQVVHLLANERILIKAAVHVVFKAGEINMQMLMGQGVTRRINTHRVSPANRREERKERPFCGGGARKNSHTVAPTSESVVRTPSCVAARPC